MRDSDHGALDGIHAAGTLARNLAKCPLFLVLNPALNLLQEYMDDSVQMLGEATGWPDSVLFRDVRSSNATPRPKVPLSAKRALQAANHLDMQLYEYAVQLFLRRGSQAAATTLQ